VFSGEHSGHGSSDSMGKIEQLLVHLAAKEEVTQKNPS